VVYRDTGRMPEPRVLGFRQRGGQVLSISTTRGTVVYSARQAILEGAVYDSTRGSALGRATVFLVGTTDSVRADEQGAFSFAVPRDGTYGVSFRHPRLDSLGVVAPTTDVVLRVGSRSTVSLAVPPEARLIQSLCPDEPLRTGERVIVGVVREHGSGRPVPGARVESHWQTVGGARGALQSVESLVRSVADSAGRYVICRAPLGLVRLRASIDGGPPAEAVYRFAEEGVWLNDDRYRSFAGRIWTVDFTVRR
ncbi:MAG TPA: hypothetical protein VNL18_11325, partial [Gemmatimonadales bacterium]|nr:hypothetical protein [Gemmatimonadales bacterium]